MHACRQLLLVPKMFCASFIACPCSDAVAALLLVLWRVAFAGTGSTLVSPELTCDTLDCGPQFLGRGWSREVTITNLGRRSAGLAWSNSYLTELAKSSVKGAKAAGTVAVVCGGV